jgi:hypothetical protein
VKASQKLDFNLNHIWANVLRNECKYGVIEAYWLDFHKLPKTVPMCNKKPLLSPFLKSVAYECCIFHLINDTQNGGTIWPKFIYLYQFSWTMCKQKTIIINHKMKKNLDVFLSTCTPIKHNNKTPFMENLKAKMWQQKLQEMSNF